MLALHPTLRLIAISSYPVHFLAEAPHPAPPWRPRLQRALVEQVSLSAMSKRTASSTSFAASNEPNAKRSASLIDAYFPSKTGPAKPPQPIVASDPITDRQSTFVAHAAPCSNHVQAQTLQKYIRNLRTTSHPVECSHEILAWRTLALKPGKTGLGSDDDFKITIDGDDDGEKGGSTIIKEVLTQDGGIDVAIVISRLYGGATVLLAGT